MTPLRRPLVILSGMIAATPRQGGATWAVLQYLLGFRRLGYDVLFVEPVDAVTTERAGYCADVMERFGLSDHWSLLGPGETSAGLDRATVRRQAGRADLLVNISGLLDDDDVLASVPVRAYLDLDPGFVQVWQAQGTDVRFGAHTHFVTLADAIGEPQVPIPTCGRSWLATLPPVVLEAWPFAGALTRRAFTTIGHWRSYGSVVHGGVRYGQKVHSFRALSDLPARTQARFELALAIHAEEPDLAGLAAKGWKLVDPDEVAGTPDAYRRFVQGSLGEFGLTKAGYVEWDAGWFSDRSACYLASGRPVVAQDTGFGRRLPTGHGLFACRSGDEMVAAVAEILSDYEHHRVAARAVAEEHLDSDRVLRALLDGLGR